MIRGQGPGTRDQGSEGPGTKDQGFSSVLELFFVGSGNQLQIARAHVHAAPLACCSSNACLAVRNRLRCTKRWNKLKEQSY